MLAHELRNPLAPISSAAHLLKVAASDEQRVKKSSEIIARQVKHMTELVDDLLDVSRVTRGLIEFDKADVSIKAIINSAIEQARPLIESRNHLISIRLGSTDACVYCDRTRLVQVIANLLNNAAKYTPHGGQITVSVERTDDEVKVIVSDNGMGIDRSLLPHVFELFTQAERTPDRSQGGLGLGLALVRSITNLHGGRVDAHSDGDGKGSVFTVTLPVSRIMAPEQNSHEGNVAMRAGLPLRVAIVDDNLDAAETLAAVLEASGHQVTVAENSSKALEVAETFNPEVFILDIGLPDMDGYELARRLRTKPAFSKTTLIALTGYGQATDRELSKAAGFDSHFVKPIEPEALMRVFGQLSSH
jgi:CheY-like chemotaxis protein